MSSIQILRHKLERQKGKKSQIEKSANLTKSRLKEIRRDINRHERARVLIREAGLLTQKQLQFHISDITSLALESIFNDPYKLEAEFIERRNKTECDLLFVKNDEKMNPMDASGGGAVDVAALALRIASWSMQNPRSDNTILLDEPLKNLSESYQEKGSTMLKEISKKLGIQFIIVTHEDTLTSFADKIFEVRQNKKGESKII